MTRPFAPRDALRLRSQQAAGTALDLEAVVLLGQSPLRQAIAGYLPWGNGGVETLVLDPPDSSGGFVQARRRLSDTEADLTFIVPSLAAANGAALCWQRLIADACHWLGLKGVLRIYAAVHEDDRVALHVFRQLGFVVYTSDIVLRRPAELAPPEPPTDMTVVPASAETESAICRLVLSGLPQSVRAKEGSPNGDWLGYPVGGRTLGVDSSYAWLDQRGAIIGAWRVSAGCSGHWLRVATDHDTDAGPPIQWALADAGGCDGLPPLPVYSAARGYEPDLNLALRENGFEPVQGRFRLVKHTAARVLEPAWRRRRLPEPGLDPAPTHSAPLTEASGPVSSPSHPRS